MNYHLIRCPPPLNLNLPAPHCTTLQLQSVAVGHGDRHLWAKFTGRTGLLVGTLRAACVTVPNRIFISCRTCSNTPALHFQEFSSTRSSARRHIMVKGRSSW